MGCFSATFVVLLAACYFGISSTFAQKLPKDNSTITDETLRELLGMISDFVVPVQIFPDYRYSMETSDMSVLAEINRTTVTDLTTYKVTVAHADMPNLEFQLGLQFPGLNASGDYELYIDDELLHLTGNGNFQVNFTSFTLLANLTFQLNANQTLEMKNVTSDFDFAYAKVNFTGLGEDEEMTVYLNDFINEFIASSMIELKPTLMDLVRHKVMPLGNFFIGGMTLQEFIDYVNSLA